MSSREKFRKSVLDTYNDIHTLYVSYIIMAEDENHIIHDSIRNMLKYADIIKDNDFDPSSKIVIDAVVDLILTAYDILIYIKNTDVEEEHCKEIVTEVMHNIMNSWKQVVTNVDNKLIIKILIEKMIKKGCCSKNMIHMSLE